MFSRHGSLCSLVLRLLDLLSFLFLTSLRCFGQCRKVCWCGLERRKLSSVGILSVLNFDFRGLGWCGRAIDSVSLPCRRG